MKLKLVPALLALGLATLLGACESATENPTQPGSEAAPPQGGAELDDTESSNYPPAPEEAAPVEGAPDTSSEIPAAPDTEAPAVPDTEAPAVPESTDPQAP